MGQQVSSEVREAETSIDATIRGLGAWKLAREATVKAILDAYRDAIELAFIEAGRQRLIAEHIGPGEADPLAAISMEHQLHTGVFWVLKWALAWCPDSGGPPPAAEEMVQLLQTGAAYQHLVDALWMNKEGWARVEADLASRTLTIFEGGDQTGRDRELAEYQHGPLAFHQHHSFTDELDKLTSRWSAGDYRALGKELVEECGRHCTDSVVFSGVEPHVELFKRPVLLRVPEALTRKYEGLIHDLGLTRDRLAKSSNFWRLSSWLDTPLVRAGGAYWCPSNIVQTVFKDGYDEHMLRLAALADAEQYSRVSQMREDRMRAFCVKVLKSHGWKCTAPYELKNPPADIDIHATRDAITVILELKSTLRPANPREVSSRNAEVHLGLRKGEERKARLSPGTIAAVVTDGYRGDYRTWADALRRTAPVITTHEIDSFATNPIAYMEELQRWAATRPIGSNPLPDRETELVGWRLFVRDQP